MSPAPTAYKRSQAALRQTFQSSYDQRVIFHLNVNQRCMRGKSGSVQHGQRPESIIPCEFLIDHMYRNMLFLTLLFIDTG